jgi:hypothetical protein
LKNKFKRAKSLVVNKSLEKLARLKLLSERLQGKCPDFMTLEDLRKMREGVKTRHHN